MSRRVRALVYSRGTISTGVHGVHFQCERPKLIMLPFDFTFNRLKELIREKLKLSPHEEMTSIVYRLPVNIVNAAVIYESLYIEGDDDMEAMLETYNVLVGQVPTLELYVEVMQFAFDLNTEVPPSVEEVPVNNSKFICPSTVRDIPTENSASSSGYRPEFDPSYTPPSDFSGGMNNIVGCSMDPNSSHQTVGSDDDEGYAPPNNLDSPYADELLCSSDEADPNEENEADSNEEMDNVDEEIDDADGFRNNDGADVISAQPIRFREYQPRATNYFNEINIEVAGNPEFGDEIEADQDLHVEKVFHTKEAFKVAVKIFSIRCGRDFIVYESRTGYEQYRCKQYSKEKCPWMIQVHNIYKTRKWRVTRLGGDHTCLCPPKKQNHRKLDSDVITSQIMGLVSDKPNILESEIQQLMVSRFGYHVTYKTAQIAKLKALTITYGDWESSYALLPRFLEATKHFMEGTIVDFQSKPIDDTSAHFVRVFWAFRPCINAFPHLKPIIQVDETTLNGKYKQTLLIACSNDGDKKIVPLAFAIVEGETGPAWKFFLSRLRAHVIGWEKQGVCLISKRADRIIEAVADGQCGWQPPYGHHVFCIRHIAKIVKENYKQELLTTMVKNIAYQMRQDKADSMLKNVELTHQECYNYLPPKEKWMQAYDEGRRFNHMTTNLVKCIDDIFKEFRKLPITGVVRASYYWLNRFFQERRVAYNAQIQSGKVFSEIVMNAMARNIARASSMQVIEFNRESLLFEVQEPYNHDKHQISRKCKLDMQAGKCDCGQFQAHHYPCVHVVAACWHQGWDPYKFVDPAFRLDTMLQAYATPFRWIGDMEGWPTYKGPTIKPNPARKRKKGPPSECGTEGRQDRHRG